MLNSTNLHILVVSLILKLCCTHANSDNRLHCKSKATPMPILRKSKVLVEEVIITMGGLKNHSGFYPD